MLSYLEREDKRDLVLMVKALFIKLSIVISEKVFDCADCVVEPRKSVC